MSSTDLGIILLVNVKLDSVGYTKAIRITNKTTVKDAILLIAKKCSLPVSENSGLFTQNFQFILFFNSKK